MLENTDEIKRADFRDACVARASNHLGMVFAPAKSRLSTAYVNAENDTALFCSIGLLYKEQYYRFDFLPRHHKFVKQYPKAYLLLGAGSADLCFLLPYYGLVEHWWDAIKNDSNTGYTIIVPDKGNFYVKFRQPCNNKMTCNVTCYQIPASV